MRTALLSNVFAAAAGSATLLYAGQVHAKQDAKRVPDEKKPGSQGLRALTNEVTKIAASGLEEDPEEILGFWDSDGHSAPLDQLLKDLDHKGVDVEGSCKPYCVCPTPSPTVTPTPAPTGAPTTPAPPTCDDDCKALCEAQGVSEDACSCGLSICTSLNILNPSFESFVGAPGNGKQTADWHVSGTKGDNSGAETLNNVYILNPTQGDWSIDMNGGDISQDIDTQIGCTYKIHFDMSNDAAADYCKRPRQAEVTASADGAQIAAFRSDFNVTQILGSTGLDFPVEAAWVGQVYKFTATSTSTNLKFESTNHEDLGGATCGAGPLLDNIRQV